MAKKVNEDIDAENIINSIRPEMPPLAQPTVIPSTEKVEEVTQDSSKDEDAAPTTTPKRKVTTRKRRSEDKSEYEINYLHKAHITVRSCKLVNVRAEYHERIMKIVRTIGKNDISLLEFIDNVLTEHFDKHEDEITRLYNQNLEGIF